MYVFIYFALCRRSTKGDPFGTPPLEDYSSFPYLSPQHFALFFSFYSFHFLLQLSIFLILISHSCLLCNFFLLCMLHIPTTQPLRPQRVPETAIALIWSTLFFCTRSHLSLSQPWISSNHFIRQRQHNKRELAWLIQIDISSFAERMYRNDDS